jgi:hypothetical protein
LAGRCRSGWIIRDVPGDSRSSRISRIPRFIDALAICRAANPRFEAQGALGLNICIAHQFLIGIESFKSRNQGFQGDKKSAFILKALEILARVFPQTKANHINMLGDPP